MNGVSRMSDTAWFDFSAFMLEAVGAVPVRVDGVTPTAPDLEHVIADPAFSEPGEWMRGFDGLRPLDLDTLHPEEIHRLANAISPHPDEILTS